MIRWLVILALLYLAWRVLRSMRSDATPPAPRQSELSGPEDDPGRLLRADIEESYDTAAAEDHAILEGQPVLSQRDMMRKLFRENAGHAGATIRAYAREETAGHVQRTPDAHELDAEDHARRLYEDGIRKGWLGS